MYKISPVDKKSIAQVFHISTMDGGEIIVEDHYRWGYGMVENKEDLPAESDTIEYVCNNDLDHEMDDLVISMYSFPDGWNEEKHENFISRWEEDGPLWIENEENEFDIEQITISIWGPFEIEEV